MNKLIQQIEKGKPFFEKVSRNIYLGAIRDGFLAAMPAILFSSIFILIASIPDVLGVTLPEAFSNWLWKIYNYSMDAVALLVSATTARYLAESVNRKMPGNKKINAVSVMLASIVSFLLMSADELDGGFSSGYMGTKGLLAAFVAAFITVNVYKFCVLRDITIKMPKEVPGTISQTFRDIFPFSFAVFSAVIIDTLMRHFFSTSFAEVAIDVFQPLFTAADGYVGISLIWGATALFWFIGVHGPSITGPATAAVVYANVELNLQLVKSGHHASHVLTEPLGSFVGNLGGTGATLVVPFLFLIFAKSKQLRAVCSVSFVPVSFSVNEPLLFGAPIILNPYFFIPFILAPMVNVCIFKFFVDAFQMNSFIYVLPWATPGPIGIVLGTGVSLLAVLLVFVLIAVDAIRYFPFIKAYDASLLEEEAKNVVQEAVVGSATPVKAAAEKVVEEKPAVKVTTDKPINVLVLCAGAGTSAMLANALTEGAAATGANITASAGAYGSHYEIMKDFDMIVLAPQVNSFYEDIKKDTDALGIKLAATKGAEYIKLTRDPAGAVAFVMSYFN
ncbi:PTS system lactose-specific EIICB component [Streptococcus pasteurianus]|nr:PTS system lactose-specific EIICB component [Streptococcus pasteurianus]